MDFWTITPGGDRFANFRSDVIRSREEKFVNYLGWILYRHRYDKVSYNIIYEGRKVIYREITDTDLSPLFKSMGF